MQQVDRCWLSPASLCISFTSVQCTALKLSWLLSGLHFTYPKDKQRAQEVKNKLIAAHDVEARGGPEELHQVYHHA